MQFGPEAELSPLTPCCSRRRRAFAPTRKANAPVFKRTATIRTARHSKAMVEFTNLPGEQDIDRIVVVPLDKLRVVERAWHA